MANLSSLDKRQFEDLFGMSSGHVMEYSINALKDLFRTTVGIDLYDEKYNLHTGSKANRMRAFWEKESDAIVGKVLNELLKVWEYENKNSPDMDKFKACQKTVHRLLGKNANPENSEDIFLEKDFGAVSFEKLPMESSMIPIMKGRYMEACHCLKSGKAPLSVIFMCGSILEGTLMGVSFHHQSEFTQASCAPKGRDGKAFPLHEWRLGSLIDAAHEVGLLGKDVKDFSGKMRDYRNYIHPFQQMSSRFNPDQDTAKICMQVLHAAVADLSRKSA